MYPSTKMTGLESLLGNFLVAHRLRLLPSLSRAHVQSLVGELRSCKPRGLKQKRACNHFCRKSQLSTRVTHILVMLGLDKWLSTPWSLSSSLWFSRKDKKYALNISNGELTVTHIHARMHTHIRSWGLVSHPSSHLAHKAGLVPSGSLPTRVPPFLVPWTWLTIRLFFWTGPAAATVWRSRCHEIIWQS